MTHILMAFTPFYSKKHNLLFLKCTFFRLTVKLFCDFNANAPIILITNNCSLTTVSTSGFTQSLLSTAFQADKTQVVFQCMSLCYMTQLIHSLWSTCSFIWSPSFMMHSMQHSSSWSPMVLTKSSALLSDNLLFLPFLLTATSREIFSVRIRFSEYTLFLRRKGNLSHNFEKLLMMLLCSPWCMPAACITINQDQHQ